MTRSPCNLSQGVVAEAYRALVEHRGEAEQHQMHLDRRLLGWGLFFIIVGAIPLAVRAGALDPGVVRGWPSLWPLLLIGWGVSLLLRGTPVEWLGGALAAVVFGIMGGGLLATGFSGGALSAGCGGQAPGKAFASQTGTLASSGRLNIELNCGSLTLRPVDGASWTVSGTETDGEAPEVRTQDGTVTVGARSRGSFFGGGSHRTDWTIAVPTAPELELGVTINAGEGIANLDGAQLGSVDATVNAGTARIDLSHAAALGDVKVTVNAGSGVVLLPVDARSARVSLNAGSFKLCLAAGAPVRVVWSGALGSNDLAGSGLTKVDDNTWESASLNPLASFLDLRASANAGSFSLDTDGSCDA